MKKLLLICALIQVSAVCGVAHVWDELAILARPNKDGTFSFEQYSYLQPTTYTNGVFFDYDNDENLDLLIMGQGGDWNISSDKEFVLLYHNMGAANGFQYECVPEAGFLQYREEGIYNPISVGDVNHDGYTDVLIMNYKDNKHHVDLYLNDNGTGRFVRQNMDLECATNGSVMFGDLNNDGWLDIEFSGYSDRTSMELRTCINKKDCSFEDVTPDNLTGAFQGQSTLADINGDGRLDIISTGNGDNWVCLASIYYNNGEGSEPPPYSYVSEAASGILGVSRANPLVADLNADGLMDMVINGEPSDGSGYRTRIYYQKEDGTFVMDTSYPIVPVNYDGGINMADYNGDGNMDIVAGGYIGTLGDSSKSVYESPLRVYENKPQSAGLAGNTFPKAPGNVSAAVSDSLLVISWDDGEDEETAVAALRYNLFVRNETTGETYTLIPSDRETGLLKVGTDLQTSLSSSVKTYSIKPFGNGEYTVGVQTLDQSYAGSSFKTCSLNVNTVTNINQATLENPYKIVRNASGVEVKCDRTLPVRIYNTNGTDVARGRTNERIILPMRGVYVVVVGNCKKILAL